MEGKKNIYFVDLCTSSKPAAAVVDRNSEKLLQIENSNRITREGKEEILRFLRLNITEQVSLEILPVFLSGLQSIWLKLY